MASFTDIKEFRLTIQDPPGAVDILQVATSASLPAAPLKDTVYNIVDSGMYVQCDLFSGATADDYYQCDLLLSDSRIGTWIDAYGVTGAIPYGIKAIIAKLGSDMRLKKTQAGAESIEYTSLSELYSYYKKMLDDAIADADASDGINTGTFVATKNPEVAGGLL